MRTAMDDPLNELSCRRLATPSLPFHLPPDRRIRPPRDKAHDPLGRWLDRYLRACGVADHATRTRLARRICAESRGEDPTPRAIDEFNIATWQERVDRILADESGLDLDTDRSSSIPGRVLLRNGGSFRSCGIVADRCIAPSDAPGTMDAQDLSSGYPASVLGAILPARLAHRWSAVMALIITIVG